MNAADAEDYKYIEAKGEGNYTLLFLELKSNTWII